MKNECGKTRPKENPYEIWEAPNGWRWHVLKKYQNPENEAKNPYAKWSCYVEGDFNEMGDTYVADIKSVARRVL